MKLLLNKKMKNVVSCIIFLILLFFSIYKCSDLLEYKDSKIKYESFFKSETNFDVIFLGSSIMYNTVLPQELWKEYGISSYNWGYANTTPAINYYLIKEVKKYTSPKLIVMDLYGLIEYDYSNNGKYRTGKREQQHVQFDALPLSLNKIQATFDIFDDYSDNEEFLWNFISYHNRWDELNEKDFNYEKITQKGASFLPSIGSNTSFELISKDKTTEIDTVCYEYLIKILEYCEENNIELLLTYMPFPAKEDQQRVANSIPKIIKDYDNVNYVNLLHENVIDYKTDLYEDNSHINFSGAIKVTSWLGDYITNNYKLDDYSNSESWNKDYEEYKLYKVDTIKNQKKLQNSLLMLKDQTYDILIEIKNNNVLNNKLTLNLLANLGINIDEINKNTRFFLIEEAKDAAVIDDFNKDEKIKINLDEDKITIYKKDNNYNIYLNDVLLSYDETANAKKFSIGITIFDSETHDVLLTLTY